jgi:integrase
MDNGVFFHEMMRGLPQVEEVNPSPGGTASRAAVVESSARLLRWVEQRYTDWPREPSVWFTRPVIRRFVDVGPSGRNPMEWLATEHSLMVMHRAFGTAPLKAKMYADVIKRFQPSAPYVGAQKDFPDRWADAQHVSRRVDAKVLVALGMTLGLSLDEIVLLRVADVEFDSNWTEARLLVRGDHYRAIGTVNRAAVAAISAACEGSRPEQFVFRSQCIVRDNHTVLNMTRTSLRNPVPGPRTGRMRATALVAKKREWKESAEVRRFFGLRSSTAIDRLEDFWIRDFLAHPMHGDEKVLSRDEPISLGCRAEWVSPYRKLKS